MASTPNSFRPKRLKDYSKSEVIAEIRRVIRDECAGVTPTRDEFERLARVSHPTIAKHFGTYKEAIRQAGSPPHKHVRPKVTPEQVKQNLFEVLRRADGYCFSQGFYRKNGGTYCEETVKRRLGVKDWQGVMEAIGAEKKSRIVHTVVSARAQRRQILADLTEADLFNEIGRVWQAKGRRPTYEEFRQGSQYGVTVYISHFGSWTKAIEDFCSIKGWSVQWHSAYSGARATNDELLAELKAFNGRSQGAFLHMTCTKPTAEHTAEVFSPLGSAVGPLR